jgi:hypothetical protein
MSITIIDSSKPLSPKFLYEDWAKYLPDEHASKLERQKFWEQEKEYWHVGRFDLAPIHYAYLTIGRIKLVDGRIIIPRWRDYDEWVIKEDSEAAGLSQDTEIVKRREFGLSSIFGGFYPIYNGLIHPGSTSLLTSADKPRVENLFNEKALVTYYGLEDEIRPGKIANRTGMFLHMGTVNKSTGKPGGVNSKIICRETADNDKNAKAFENYRAIYIFLDELFCHDRASQVVRSSQACLSEGLSKKGHMVIGGSCGNMTAQGAKEGQNMWEDAYNLGIKTIFIPGTACIEMADELDDNGRATGKKLNFCVNGHSDEKKAEEWILKTRERLGKAKDKRFLEGFVVQYPLNIGEVFENHSKGSLPEYIYPKLKESQRKINTEEFVEGRYSLRTEGSKVKADFNKSGKFVIVIPPNENMEAIAGCDPIPFGTAQIEKGSDFAVLIKDRISQRYCAYYAERLLDSDEVINNTILLQQLYRSSKFPSGALMNVEMNRGEIVLEKYKQHGKLHLLSDRLVNLGIAYESKHESKGWYNNDKTGARANDIMIEYLKSFGDQITLQRLIDELLLWPNGNLDLLDAMKSCELLDKELRSSYAKVYMPPPKQKRMIRVRDSEGRTIIKWI